MNDTNTTAAQPIDLDKLEALAKIVAENGASWTACGPSYGANLPKYLDQVVALDEDGNESHRVCNAPDWSEEYFGERTANMEFIAAANPATILQLIAQARASQPESATGTTGAAKLSDAGIVEVLASMGVDSEPSKFGFKELQVRTTVPTIRKVVERYLGAPASAHPDRGAAQVADAPQYENVMDHNGRIIGVRMTNADKMPSYAAASPASQLVAPVLTKEQIEDIIQAIKTSMNFGAGIFVPRGWNVLLDKLHVMRNTSSTASQPVAPDAALPKPWQERVNLHQFPNDRRALMALHYADQEIAELRAALAAVAPSDALVVGNAESADKVIEHLPNSRLGTRCPMCGVDHPHTHTPREITIFRNGAKYAARQQEYARADDQVAAQDEAHDAGGTGAGGRAGAHEHHEHRARQSDADGRDGSEDGGSSRVSDRGEVREAVAPSDAKGKADAAIAGGLTDREAFVDYWKRRFQYSPTYQFLDRNGDFCTPEDDPIHMSWETWLDARAAATSAADAKDAVGLPRTPTEAMLNAARDWSVKKYGIGVGNDDATGCWQVMYDAAMADAPSSEKGGA